MSVLLPISLFCFGLVRVLWFFFLLLLFFFKLEYAPKTFCLFFYVVDQRCFLLFIKQGMSDGVTGDGALSSAGSNCLNLCKVSLRSLHMQQSEV